MTAERDNTKVTLTVVGFILKMFLNILFYVVVIYGVYVAGKGAYDFCYQIFGDEVYADETGVVSNIQITIAQGETTMSVASKLETYNIIKSRYTFYIKIKLMGFDIMPGTYIISSSMTYDEILEIICG